MNKFSAESCIAIGAMLGKLATAFEATKTPGVVLPKLTPGHLSEIISATGIQCKKIGLIQSAKFAKRFVDDETHNGSSTQADLKIKLDCLEKLIISEMEDHLFLWVPGHRAEWYGRHAESIIGDQCCKRFPSIKKEVEEAAKCYAVGRYTASGFHITRAAEAGVQALAKAIKFKPAHNHWNLVFRKLDEEFKKPPAQRPNHWKTHGKFLTMVWGDLTAVAKVWRNDLAHLVDNYIEEEAKDLLAMLPKLLRDLATKMDEKGKLY